MARIGGVVVQRTPAVSGEFLRLLRVPELEDWLDEYKELEDHRLEAADRVSDAAATRIGGEESRVLRRALINMRRAVHNDQRTKAWKEYRIVVRENAFVESFDDWASACRRLENHVTLGEELFERGVRHAEDRIVEQAMHRDIGATIVSASQTLGRDLLRLDELPTRVQQNVKWSLGEYVLRAATRTTPFGGFTRVSLLRTGESTEGAFIVGGAEALRVPRLNIEVLAAIRALFIEDPVLRRELTVRLTDGIAFTEGRIRYVRRRAGRIHESGRVTQRSEDVFFLSSDILLEVVFRCFEEVEEWTLGSLISEVSQRLADVSKAEEVEGYVVELLRQAFIVAPVFDFSILEIDPLARLIEKLSVIDKGPMQDLRKALVEARSLVAMLESSDVGSTMTVLDRIAGVIEPVGLSADRLPSPLVYLDTVDASSGSCSPSMLESLAGIHLENLSGVLPIFDRILPDKLLLQGFLRYRHGQDEVIEDVLKLAQEFNEDLYDAYRERMDSSPQVDANGCAIPVPNWLGLKEIDLINSERVTFTSEFAQRYRRWHAEGASELELDHEFFDSCRSSIPVDPVMNSRTVIVQPVHINRGETRLLVNGFYAGFGLMPSRFLHADRSGARSWAQEVRSLVEDRGAKNVIYAEISGGHDSTNLNLHRQTLEWQIVCPGEGPRGERSSAIALEELVVVWRDGRAVLWSLKHDRQVVPVYQGFLTPFALPDLQRVLMLFSPMSVPVLDLWSGVDPPLGDKNISDHPRVHYGPLILVRHVWKMRPEYVPVARQDESRALWLTRLEEWRITNGLPMRVYATVDVRPPSPSASPGRTKPQFVDFRSPWSLKGLERLARSAYSRVVLTEALPDPSGDSTPAGFGTDRATELVMEVNA